jgi:trimethylamine--corrinoid protein Co-methyltransferase
MIEEPVGGQLEILTRSDLDRIHGATMEVLRRVGVKVWEAKSFSLFKDAGADVDPETLMVRPSESLVKETIRKAPSEFYMYGRDPKYKLHMGARKVHFSVAGQTIRMLDPDGRVRPQVLRDSENVARVADWCSHVHHVSVGTTPKDVPDDIHPLYHLAANWKNSIKTSDGYNYGRKLATETMEMLSILRGGDEQMKKTPTILGFTNPVSPLQLSKELMEGAIVYARNNQPMLYAPEALSGGTAPATLAGLTVQQNAEVLSGIMVSQLASPGAPVLYGTVSAVMDMKTGATALGGPEVGLLNVAAAQLARYYNLPCRGTGGNTDSKTIDPQAFIETSTSLMMAGLAGMNFIYDAAGSLDGSLTMSLEKIVIDNELAGMVARTLEGISVTDETLAIDEICRVGPTASYLSSPFTARMFRKEHFIPELADRRSREAWQKDGGKDLVERAKERVRWILKEHHPDQLDKDISASLDSYLKKTAKEHGH